MKVGLTLACYPQLVDSWNYNLPPLGLGYLASYGRQYVPGVEFVIERSLDDLIAHKPDLVGITYVTYNASYAARQAERVKEELGVPVICGGPHVSTLPTVLDPVFDLAVLGEGEETFADVLRLFRDRGRLDPADLRNLPGILFRDEAGTLVRTPPRPAIQDLDSIPWPDRSLMYANDRGSGWGSPGREVQIMTSRGCPYDCSFCSTVKHWGTRYRYPTNEYVLGEIESIIRDFSPKLVNFYDDLFVVRKDRVLQILEGIRARGLHQGTEYTAFVRSNLLDDELMEAFAATNFRTLNIGFESGSDAMLKTFNKQASNVGKNQAAVDLGRKHGVRYSSCFIIGGPGEQRADILDTFRFVQENMDALYYVEFAPLTIFPGTQLWQQAAREIGLNDQDLSGVVLEPGDLGDERDFILHRWPYLNAENIPREEFYTYFQLGVNLAKAVWKYHGERRRAESMQADRFSPDRVAENVPIADIVAAKAKRQLRKIMPMGDRYHAWDDASARERAEGGKAC